MTVFLFYSITFLKISSPSLKNEILSPEWLVNHIFYLILQCVGHIQAILRQFWRHEDDVVFPAQHGDMWKKSSV